MLRLAICIALSVLVMGCAEPIQPLSTPETADSSPAPADAASPKGGSSGETATAPPSEPGQPMAEETASQPPVVEPAPEPKPKKGVIHQTTDKVVDAKEWLKKEGIEGKNGDIEGVDPLSRAASSYFTLAAQASTLGLQSAIKNYRALNDRYPTYEEFMKMMRENRIEFAQLRWYEIYGYNEDTGKIMVLVDTVAQQEGP
ncbi:hypothetical protein DTL42_25110 [Bremerella cremea]|uniref:Uncharacterized protein n=1 Tax=Bremerella cremea TaxID=1031537 RepID=A0A368KJA4_9BACT|nr:hypothetical protein [Bremerella cremea]RCS40651.1 hypothetical protein DTL42_25110 [Bremerella cremea]